MKISSAVLAVAVFAASMSGTQAAHLRENVQNEALFHSEGQSLDASESWLGAEVLDASETYAKHACDPERFAGMKSFGRHLGTGLKVLVSPVTHILGSTVSSAVVVGGGAGYGVGGFYKKDASLARKVVGGGLGGVVGGAIGGVGGLLGGAFSVYKAPGAVLTKAKKDRIVRKCETLGKCLEAINPEDERFNEHVVQLDTWLKGEEGKIFVECIQLQVEQEQQKKQVEEMDAELDKENMKFAKDVKKLAEWTKSKLKVTQVTEPFDAALKKMNKAGQTDAVKVLVNGVASGDAKAACLFVADVVKDGTLFSDASTLAACKEKFSDMFPSQTDTAEELTDLDMPWEE